jgi:hypothetical protein
MNKADFLKRKDKKNRFTNYETVLKEITLL